MKKTETFLTTILILVVTLSFGISLKMAEAEDLTVDGEDISLPEDVDDDDILPEKKKALEEIHELIQRKIYLKWRLEGVELENEISAKSFLVSDLSEDEHVLIKRDEEISRPIASVTKLMSAVIAAENIDENEKISLKSSMLNTYGYSPSLFPGAEVRAKDLMKAALIQSTNDAAESLTYFMDKGVFVGLMNIKAHQIGMKDSFFYDSHGLSPKNKATASDIVRLLNYIDEEHPEIFEITCEEDFQLPNPYGRSLTFKNLNIFPDIPGFIGGKTGYLPEAKQTYATLFELNGRTYAAVILRSDNRKEDVDTIFRWLEENPEFKD
ncbi:MAG: D-alanyl-D-alanine carboxypeptidase family protein [Patescibacteria group bacterium]